jgi:transcriptional regulator of arginine metabolism
MTQKTARQQAILGLVREKHVATQGELQKLLRGRGHDVNQGTLSRDIRELGLVKVPGNGSTHYAPVESVSPVVQAEATALVARWAKSVECAANLVVVKTDPGNANPVGVAIDRLLWSDVVGTVAGDDTLLVVARDGVRAKAVARRIINLRGS